LRAPPLPLASQDDRTLRKIVRLDEHIALAFAGLSADARVLINKVRGALTHGTVVLPRPLPHRAARHGTAGRLSSLPAPPPHPPPPFPRPPLQARIECQSYRLTVEDAPSVEYISRHLGQVQQKYTQRGGVRPFGISCLIGGVGADGVPQLWATDPSGTYTSWKANAVGSKSKSLLELLEKQYRDGMSEEEGLKLAVRALLEVVESGAKSIEIAVLRTKQPLAMVAEDKVEALVKAIDAEKEAEAKAAEGAAPAAPQ
jgi:20S proteasome subunit alpha 4